MNMNIRWASESLVKVGWCMSFLPFPNYYINILTCLLSHFNEDDLTELLITLKERAALS